ncbi:MAG: hypothetical protein U1E76_13030 [Planctomycetota bacterium]
MTATHRSWRLLRMALVALAQCAAAARAGVTWEMVEVWRGDDAFERIKVGRPDPGDPRLQIVAVDQGGHVVLVHYDGGVPRASVVHHHRSELTGLVVADVDPAVPGEEIYVGGAESGEQGGTVTQIVITEQGANAARIWLGGAYVHSIERVDPGVRGEPARLLVATYAGEIHLLTPAARGEPWPDRILHREATSADPEDVKIKDAAFLRAASGGARHEALVVFKTGRALLLDIERPEQARFVHTEPGGLSRVTADADGGAYLTGYQGRVLHLARAGDAWRIEVMAHEGPESGLRGLVLGRFPLPQGGVAPMAVFGFHGLCRALTPRLGAWDTTTLFRDRDRGHTIEAADLVAGNDADELIVSGYSRRIAVLVARGQG